MLKSRTFMPIAVFSLALLLVSASPQARAQSRDKAKATKLTFTLHGPHAPDASEVSEEVTAIRTAATGRGLPRSTRPDQNSQRIGVGCGRILCGKLPSDCVPLLWSKSKLRNGMSQHSASELSVMGLPVPAVSQL